MTLHRMSKHHLAFDININWYVLYHTVIYLSICETWTYLLFMVLILLRRSLGGKADFSDASGSEPYLSTY